MVGQIPWIGRYVKVLPGVGTDLKRFRAWAMERFAARKNEVSKRKDLFYHLVRNLKLRLLAMLSTSDAYLIQSDEAGIEKQPIPTPVILSDSTLVIIAGQ